MSKSNFWYQTPENISKKSDKYDDFDQNETIDVVIDEEHIMDKPNIRVVEIKNDKNQKLKVRKKELFDRLDSQKLTYVRGSICDSFIKYGYPSLDQVISDVKEMTDQEESRLAKLLAALKRRGLRYDARVSYYKEYIEQGTSLKTTIKEGKKEWFYLNMTDYLELVDFLKDEDRAQNVALHRYIDKNGYDHFVQKYIQDNKTVNMRIRLY